MKCLTTLTAILVLLVSGCISSTGQFSSRHLPEMPSSTTGVLVVATEATNRTHERFAYYYAFVSANRPDFQLNIRLFETRKVAVISDLMPGQYTLTGVKIVSEPNSQVKTFVAPDIRQINHPITFTIQPGGVTVLDYGLVVAQFYPNGIRLEDIVQNIQVKRLSAGDRGVVLQQLGSQGNLAAWTIVDNEQANQVHTVAYTNSSKAFIRTFIRRYDD